MGKTAVLARLGERELQLTNLEKRYWPEDGYTKADLVAYYTRIAPVLLPYLRDRPLVLTRYPDGIHGQWFYNKNFADKAPDWIRTCPVQHEEGEYQYLLADEPAALAFMANLGAIEIHPWLSRCGRLDRPDHAVIDLDPAEGATPADVRTIAVLVRQILDSLGLQGVPKHSGATGIHIYCPCTPDHTYAETAGFCEAIGRLLARVYPQKVTMERMVARRTGKVYVDYLQNRAGQTITAVYGVRPRSGAPVSIPLTWQEIESDAIPRHSIRTVWQRLEQVGDLFRPVMLLQQDLRHATEWLRRQ